MSTTILPVSEAKQRFTELVKNTEQSFDRFLITKNGKEAAVVMSAQEYDSLLETLEILSNTKEVRALARGLAELEQNQTVDFKEYLERKQKKNSPRSPR
ncbi:MAG: type II toxin-antitoxin system Phd/YefM family antitoxin [Deltaproteobacteria bacterium]|nr:type II toxin-antitoxin system Phd/YefM family antitoxin [Ignavibacteriales bacterium]MBI3754350.1 type II toxin-antitoxin system Phd/YefM family antitoxin [Deltaproteobacteria bacterium]